MNEINPSNPISGLSANQIVLLLEQGSNTNLSDTHRELAIAAIGSHLHYVPEATLESSIHALVRVTSLRCFASTANKLFLGHSLDGQDLLKKAI